MSTKTKSRGERKRLNSNVPRHAEQQRQEDFGKEVVNASSQPLDSILGTYEGEAWEEALKQIKQSNQEDLERLAQQTG